jgi:hypothetical protein
MLVSLSDATPTLEDHVCRWIASNRQLKRELEFFALVSVAFACGWCWFWLNRDPPKKKVEPYLLRITWELSTWLIGQ